MRKPGLFLLLVVILFSASCKKQPATGRAGVVGEADLVGDWTTIKGDAEYVTFAKEDGENIYGAYLRGRPLYNGTWKLEDGRLTIIAENGTKTVYKVVLKDGVLDLNDGEERYERLIVKSGEDMVRELLGEAAKAVPARFSAIKKTEMNWNRRTSPETDPETIEIKGWKMSAEIKIKGDFTELNEMAGKIAAFFADEKGFTGDELNMAETVSGYTLGDYILLIAVRSDPEPVEGERAYIDVICGWLP